MKQKEEKYCGECCWFYGEDTYGYGFCPFRFAETHECGQRCEVPLKYVSKKEMRHHMAVLLQYHRADESMNYLFPGGEALEDAVVFAYRYMKVFSEL
jgi:hypothetical protein